MLSDTTENSNSLKLSAVQHAEQSVELDMFNQLIA